jgi:hypothetical protein
LRIVPPVIGPFEFDGSLLPGDGGQLSCYVAKGDLPLTITWSFHGKAVDAKTPNISTLKIGARTSLLTLENVNFSHSGTYTCVAKNDAGSSQHSAELVVNGNSYTGTGKKRITCAFFLSGRGVSRGEQAHLFLFCPVAAPSFTLQNWDFKKTKPHLYIRAFQSSLED